MRARADAEQAEAQSAKLQREVERLKRELSRAVRATSPTPSVPEHQEQHNYRDSMMNGGYGGSSAYGQSSRDTGSFGRQSQAKRMSYASNLGADEKENGFERERARMASPTFQSVSSASEGRNSPSRGVGNDNAESWKRAAEVTNALKARIEQMKRQNGIGGSR